MFSNTKPLNKIIKTQYKIIKTIEVLPCLYYTISCVNPDTPGKGGFAVPKTIQIPVDDSLHESIAQKAKASRLTLAAYCRLVLAEAASAVISIGIPPDPNNKNKKRGRPESEEAVRRRKEKQEARERRLHGGMTLDECIAYWSRPLEEIDPMNRSLAANNLAIYMKLKQEQQS